MINTKFPYVYKHGEELENNHYVLPERTEGCRRYVLTVPENGDYLALILGAISSLRSSKHYNPSWAGYAPSQEFQKIVVDLLESEGYTVPIKAGDIKMAAGLQSDTWLLCDGEVYSVDDYPLLFAAIGDTFGDGGANTFRVPDFIGRFPMGTDLTVIGDFGGSATHQLTVDELPSHNHTVNEAFPSVTSIEAGVPQDIAIINPTVTGSTGGNVAHNNLPPYLGVAYYIFTGIVECVPCEQPEIVLPGGMVLLASYLASDSASIIVSEVNDDYEDYFITGRIGRNTGSGGAQTFIRPNAIDNSANYEHSRLAINSSGLGSVHDSGRASLVHFDATEHGVQTSMRLSKNTTDFWTWDYMATSLEPGNPLHWSGGGNFFVGINGLSNLTFSNAAGGVAVSHLRIYALPN